MYDNAKLSSLLILYAINFRDPEQIRAVSRSQFRKGCKQISLHVYRSMYMRNKAAISLRSRPSILWGA